MIVGGGGEKDLINFRPIDSFEVGRGITFDLRTGIINDDPDAVTITGVEEFHGSGYDDHLIGDGDDNVIDGHDGNDILSGAAGNDVLRSGYGSDSLYGGDGDDTLENYGSINGAGYLDGGTGDDLIKSSWAEDSLYGAAGNDSLNGGYGNDILSGGAGNDLLRGGYGNDSLYGGDCDETLSGSNGNDTLSGGSGNDVFVFSGGVDRIADFSDGADRIDLRGVGVSRLDQLTLTGDGEGAVIAYGDGSLTLAGVSPDTLETDDFIFSEIQPIITPPPNPDPPQVEEAGGGGNGGGGPPPNTQVIGTHTVSTTTTTGADGVTRASRVIAPKTGDTGAAAPPVTLDSHLTVTLPDGVGMQTRGPSKAQKAAPARVELKTEVDKLTDDPAEQARLDARIEQVTARFMAEDPETEVAVRTVKLTLAAGADPTGQSIKLTGAPDAPAGTSVKQALVVDGSALPAGAKLDIDNIDFVTFVGGHGVVLRGGAGANYAVLGGGADDVQLGADDNTLEGGAGADRIGSTAGNDLIYGNQGADTVTGGADQDTLFGGQDGDLVYGNQGLDIAYGNKASDTLYGRQHADTLYGGQADDLIYGNRGADVVYGNRANDTLFGGRGDDALSGGLGDDWLFGNRGDDTLAGGAGADRFHFAVASGGHDVVTDFAVGVDQLVVSGSGAASVADFLTMASLADNGDGDAVLRLGDGFSVTLLGVKAADLSGDDWALA